jgi:hypothetical protein
MKAPEREALPLHLARKPNDTVGKEIRKSIGATGPYVERQRRPGEVRAPELNIWDRTTYRTGDGDYTAQVPRAGSMDAYKLPSRGNRT